MEALDLALLIFIAGVAIVSAIGFFKSYKNKDE
jgi:hypothetical protein